MVKVETLTEFMNRRKIAILLFWVVIGSLLIGLYAGNFLNVTTNEFNAPEGTDAYEANALLEQYFPERVNELSHIIVVHNPNGPVISSALTLFTGQVVNELQSKYSDILVQISGYVIFDGTDLDFLKFEFLSQDLSTSIITYRIDADLDVQEEVVRHMRDFIAIIKIDGFETPTVGQLELQLDTNESIESDLARIDSITIPLVFIALAFLLRNWKYFPITVVPIFMTIAISFGILERYIILTDSVVQSFVPSVLISLTLGIGVDYNLFLLTRFKEERKAGKTVYESVNKMMKYAGHTIFTSGLTLIIALSGLAFFPISVLASVGVAISVSILVLLAMNLTFTPSLLLLVGSWIEKDPDVLIKVSDEQRAEVKSTGLSEDRERSGWYRVGKFATRRKFTILGVILLLTLPLSFQILNSSPDNQMVFFSPRGSDSSEGFELLQDKFGPGVIAPTNVVIGPNDGNVWSLESFNMIQEFIVQSIEKTELSTSNIQSHTFLGGQIVDYSIAMAFQDVSSIYYDTVDGMLYRQFAMQYVNFDNGVSTAAMVEILFPMDPASPEAAELLSSLINIAEGIFGNAATYGFSGYTANVNSMVDSTYELFPLMILFVIIGIYILVGLMFRAVILPARLIATIGLTMSFIYGAATVVFEYTTFLNNIFPNLDAVSVTFWMVPVMSFSIILGLGIDYDIFTIERIKENYWNGMSNEEAIAEGIDKTARVITGAGIIMVIAFGGMMFSSSYILVQFGFVLSFSVLLDTFVVRTLLVPSIMGFGEKWNWWPNKPPVPVDVIEIDHPTETPAAGD
ncbi:MAG: MMPL family transporter [Candidatus Kariarchaeaceae archaeon]|jgi:uncharacterized membrane protein YdfJ with MMPL/SSD domain